MNRKETVKYSEILNIICDNMCVVLNVAGVGSSISFVISALISRVPDHFKKKTGWFEPMAMFQGDSRRTHGCLLWIVDAQVPGFSGKETPKAHVWPGPPRRCELYKSPDFSNSRGWLFQASSDVINTLFWKVKFSSLHTNQS